MKNLILIPALLLAACAHGPQVPPSRPPAMPDLPVELSKKAEPLPPLTDPTLRGLQIDAIETDKKYNGVRSQLNTIIDAWGCVKLALSENKDASDCFRAAE